jgi:hypothetical protein
MLTASINREIGAADYGRAAASRATTSWRSRPTASGAHTWCSAHLSMRPSATAPAPPRARRTRHHAARGRPLAAARHLHRRLRRVQVRVPVQVPRQIPGTLTPLARGIITRHRRRTRGELIELSRPGRAALIKDRRRRPAPLQLEESGCLQAEQHAVPKPSRLLAARNRRHDRTEN